MKRENRMYTICTILLAMAFTGFLIIAFTCVFTKPDKHKYLPLDEINTITELDDNVIIIVTNSGDHYAFEIDEEED